MLCVQNLQCNKPGTGTTCCLDCQYYPAMHDGDGYCTRALICPEAEQGGCFGRHRVIAAGKFSSYEGKHVVCTSKDCRTDKSYKFFGLYQECLPRGFIHFEEVVFLGDSPSATHILEDPANILSMELCDGVTPDMFYNSLTSFPDTTE